MVKMIKFIFKRSNSYSNDQIWIQMDQSRVDSALPSTGFSGRRYRPVRVGATHTARADLHVTSNRWYRPTSWRYRLRDEW
jgi:hypothetical protein